MENIAVCDAYFEIRSIEVTELINKELFGKNVRKILRFNFDMNNIFSHNLSINTCQDPKVLLEFGDLVYQTAVRHEAGAQTAWHFDPPLILECDNFQIDHNSLTISVFDNNEITFDVLIGKTSLPLTEVVDSPTKTEHKNVMAMELKSNDGKKAGVFNMDIIHRASEPGPHISGERFQPRRVNKSPLLLFENSKPGSPGNALTLGGGGMVVTGLKKYEKKAKDTIQEEMELWKTNVLEHHAAPKVQWKELDDQGSEVSDDRSKSGSLRASIGGMSMKLHLEHNNDEGDAYSDPSDTMPGKIRWREGRYKLGKKQFIANPYIFIPGKMMLQSSFNFTSIFKDLKLTVPSLIFRLSRALKTSTWNVKLPPSRKYLVDAYKKLLEIKSKQGGNTNPVKRNPQHTDLLIESTAPPPTSEDEYTKNLRGSIDHYHKVLDENCRRLLRSTNAACIQAQTLYQLTEIWSDDCDEDVVAEWAQLSNPKGPMPIFLGIADKTDFHESVWAQLRKGCVENYQQAEKDGKEPEEVIIDPTPFFDKRIPVTYNPITGHPTKSIPHPALTHLIISDNRTLLEQKIAEVVLWGVILINGGIREAELGAQAVQLGLPMVAFKYTGGAADIIIDMAEKVDKWVHQKRAKMLTVAELPPRPFPDDIQVGFLPPGWMKPFDQHLVVSCCLLNKLIENWPDRYNKQSVFCIDMFETPEDEVQDRLTLTVGVVSGGDYELGGVASEQKRISYAWRCRQKFLYNAFIYLVIADMLQILLALFILFSTLAATFYTFTAFAFYNPDRFPPGLKPLSASKYKDVMTPLLLINIVVPLIGTVIRGITAAISPYMKYVALTNACVRIEGEVYTFRCKVAQYSSLKQDDDDDEEEEEGGEGEKGDDAADDAGLPNPRKTFFQALDRIWADLSASGEIRERVVDGETLFYN